MSDQTQTQAGPTNGLHEESGRDQAQQKAQDAAGQAKEQAQQAAGKAQDRARQLVDERSTQVGGQISGQAGDLRSVGEQLRSQGKDGPAKVADQAAERVERLGGYLERSDADTILGDAEDLARRNPWAVALGGLALGFAASRFLKASSQQRYQTRQGAAPSTTPPQLPRQTAPTPQPTAPPPITPVPTGHV
jgi:hypothetical protein